MRPGDKGLSVTERPVVVRPARSAGDRHAPPRGSTSRRIQRRRRLPPAPLLLAAVVLLLLALAARRLHPASPVALSAPTPTVTAAPTTAATASPAPSPAVAAPLAPLGARLAGMTAPLQGTYGVWVYDLTTGVAVGQHEHQQFIAASVIKTYILAALYEQAAAGKLSLDEKMTTSSADIQNFGTGSIRYDPVGSSYTLAELARRAARQSDNTAAFLITKRLGQDAIQARLKAWGLTETSIADDRTTPADIGTLFVKLARRQLLPGQSALDLLGLLTDTDFEDRLPALLPSYALVAHKIGTEANGVDNDAGLVVLPTRSYVVAILTDGADPDQAIAAEQQLSQAVYTYEAALP